ncbi:MAG: signal peptidase [Pseudonocardiales bacterium]|nr:signal peptidase [Pseudonocardiales bacterium]
MAHVRDDAGPAAGEAAGLREPAPPSLRGFLASVVVLMLLVGAFSVFVIRPFLAEPFYIPSASMEPTLHGCDGCVPDRVLVDKLSYRFRSPARGEVVVFDRPANLSVAEDRLIKRVIGLPGETVSGHDGAVWIGDRPLDEPYVNPACNGTADFGAVTVPAGRVFVMGDNRCNSLDGRVFGPIKESTIVGRAFLIVWPLDRLHWL